MRWERQRFGKATWEEGRDLETNGRILGGAEGSAEGGGHV